MLVISRKLQKGFTVFDPDGVPVLEVTIVDVRGDKTRLGIDAPKEFRILRNELIDDAGDDPPSEAA